MRRRPGLGGGTQTGGTGSGGTPYNPHQKVPSPKPSPTITPDYITPPFLSFDPAIEAQRRAAQRGLQDTEADVKTEQHFSEKNLAQALRDIRTNTSRKRGGINRDAFRAERKFTNEEEDVNKKGQRGNEDFDTQLANIGRQFAQLGHRQGEAANAAGVLDTGTMAAAGAARAGNQRLAEAPINTGRERLNEDLATALGRLSTGRADLGEDTGRALTQLTQDRNRERKGNRQKTARETFLSDRKLERARREGAISDVDLLAQEIYAARAEHPAVFKNWKTLHPDAIAGAEARAGANKATGGNPQSGVGGGTAAPHKKKKGGR